MFSFPELTLLRLALDALQPKPANANARAALLKKVRALAVDGLLPPVEGKPVGPRPDAATLAADTVKLVYMPLYRALLNVYRMVDTGVWCDETSALATVFPVLVALATHSPDAVIDFDRLVRIALGALADLPASDRTKDAIAAARLAVEPVTGPGGDA